MFKYIFPKTNELSVFVIAVTLYSLPLYVPEVAQGLLAGVEGLWVVWLQDLKASDSLISDAKYLSGFVLFVVTTLFYLIGPLFLPFTEKDIRGVSLIILWTDGVLLIYSLIASDREYPPLIIALVLYYLAWLIYSVIVVRVNFENGIRLLVCDSQTNPKIALMSAFFSVILTSVLILFLSLWWLEAYLTAVGVALFLIKFLDVD